MVESVNTQGNISNCPKVSSVARNFAPVAKRDTTIFANFFQVKINQSGGAPWKTQLNKYSIIVTPEVPDKLFKVLMS